MGERPHVDYSRAAGRYDRGRGQTDDALDRWWVAMRAHMPAADDPVVLDLGSGTGIFSGAWARWTGGTVLAVEPSPDMRAKALPRRVDGVVPIGGDGRRLPLRSGSVDVVWMSTVLHHLDPLAAALDEVARVGRPEVVVFVRGFVPGRSRVPWLDHFARPERTGERFPTEAATTEALAAVGFALDDAVEVPDAERYTYQEAADWVEFMRGADSMLAMFTDDEIDAGRASLLESPQTLMPPLALTLLTYVRSGP